MQIRSIFGVLLVVSGVLICGRLGYWQLNRAEEKRDVIQRFETQQALPAISLPTEFDHDEHQYRNVEISGDYQQQQFLLDNQIYKGQFGYQVLTPFKLTDGRAILVDRGWQKGDVSRRTLPSITFAATTLTLNGRLHFPSELPLKLGSFDNGQAEWPQLIQYIDLNAISERLGYEIVPVVVNLGASEQHGYTRDWATVTMTPDKHLGYAVQWFGLAITLFIMSLAFAYKTRKKHDTKHA